MRGAAWGAALLLAAAPAFADDPLADNRPVLFPTRDVDVTYRMAQSDAPGGPRLLQQRMRYAVTAHKLRVDPPSPGLYMIVDYATHHLETIRDSQRMVMEMDAPGAMAGPVSGGPTRAAAAFRRHGVGQVAGLDCTEWETRDAAGEPALVCLTADGVLLRAVGAGRVLLEATNVTYGTIDPAVFQIPDGYTRLTPPPLSSAVPLPRAPARAPGAADARPAP
jgi:hypothetical protein